MNRDSEQITLDKNLVIAQDQPLSDLQLRKSLVNILGMENCRIITIPPRKKVLEYNKDGKKIHFLIRSCT